MQGNFSTYKKQQNVELQGDDLTITFQAKCMSSRRKRMKLSFDTSVLLKKYKLDYCT